MGRYRYKKVHGKQVQEHILVWEQANGRKLPTGYDIHHIDGNGHNNDLSNLMLIEHGEHAKLHHEMRRKGIDPVNPDDPDVIATRDYLKRYYQKHKEEIQEKHREYRKTHVNEIREQRRQYREENKDKINAWVESNRDHLLEYQRAYQRANPDRVKLWREKRKALHGDEISAYLREYRSKYAELLRLQQHLNYLKRINAPTELIVKVETTIASLKEMRSSDRVLEIAPCIDYALETHD